MYRGDNGKMVDAATLAGSSSYVCGYLPDYRLSPFKEHFSPFPNPNQH